MASLHMMLSVAMLAILGGEVVHGYEIALPGCPDSCGNVSIPYPFGTKEGCYLDSSFLITCDDAYNPPKAFLQTSTINVTEIMLLSGEFRTLNRIAHRCFESDGTVSSFLLPWFSFGRYSISYNRNKFTVVGCDVLASFNGSQSSNSSTGCLTICDRLDDVTNGTCTGRGCCQLSIPRRATEIGISLTSFNNHRSVWNFDRCSYAFVVEENAYNFSSLDFNNLENTERLPVIVDWTIADKNCSNAKEDPTSYACKENSDCYDSLHGEGYICNCTHGYEGNPYLPNGCQDIDECAVSQPCNGKCINTPGSYSCPCQEGYKGNGKKDGMGCIAPTPTSTPTSISISIPIASKSDRQVLAIALGVSLSFSILLLAGVWLYWGLQKRKLIEQRKKYFELNGGATLQQLLLQHEREIDTFKIFTAEELNKATNNYDNSKVLGQGGQGTVYEGELPDTTIVAVKKSNAIDKNQVQQFVNEVVVLSQINHRNVVRLLGCCLETEFPMLVYEFITNGTLFEHIQKDNASQMSWHTRLRIAAEIAGALSYLHSSAAIPIIHRDIKTTNILLDDNYTAKVSDFGTSKFSPVDRTSLTTLVQGTFGYLDPEYFYSSHLTEKSDVYSFGVVLVELLTGEKAVNLDRKEDERSLAMYFVLSTKEGRLFDIIDENLRRQASDKQLTEVAMIAAKCLNVKGEDRPTMRDVAVQLEGIAKGELMHPWVEVDINDDRESEVLLRGSIRSVGNTSLSIGYAAIER